MTHAARTATKLVLHKQTCFSLKDLVWASSIYTMQGCVSGWDSQMTLFWSCVLGQKGQVSIFFGPVQGAGKPAASPKIVLVPPERERELTSSIRWVSACCKSVSGQRQRRHGKVQACCHLPLLQQPCLPLRLQKQNIFSTAPMLLLCASWKTLGPNTSCLVASHSPPSFTIFEDEHFHQPWPSAFFLLRTEVTSFAAPWECAGWERGLCDSVCGAFALALTVVGIVRVSTVPRSLTRRWVEAGDLPSHRGLARVLGLTETLVKGNN